MRNIHIKSVSNQYERPAVLNPLLTLFTRAHAMGVLRDIPISEVTPKSLRTVLDGFQRCGLLGSLRPQLERLVNLRPSEEATDKDESALSAALTAVDQSPLPQEEWPSMRDVFGDEALAALAGVSISSLRRYAGDERRTPDEVADRLHWLAMVVADLSGSYNELGIRRWFDRPRAQLQGRSPRAVLGTGWSVVAPGARRVRELARSLVSGGAT